MVLAMSRPWKHPTTGFYYLRKGVPDDLRPLIGKREEKFSLGTKDPAEAKQRHVKALAELEQKWINLRGPVRSLTPEELIEAHARVYEIALKQDPNSGFNWNTEVGATLWEEPPTLPLEAYLDGSYLDRTSQHSLQRSPQRQMCLDNAKEYMKQLGLRLGEASQLDLAKTIGLAFQRAELDRQKLRQGDFSVLLVSTDAPKWVSGGKIPNRKAVSFKALLDGWAAEKQPVEKTLYTWDRVLKQVGDFVRHDDATRLTADDLVQWKSSLIEAGLRTKTIRDSKLAPLRAILQWGVDNRKLDENPASRITIDVKVKRAEGIRGFTEDEAKLILGQAAKETDPVKHWVPLLGAYSGARLAELCQLRFEDIIQIDGIWCMKFDPEAGSLKNDNSERAVPLHPAIVEAGFLKFVEKIGKGALFPRLKTDRFGSQGGIATKIIGKWVRDDLGLTDERLSPSHSWRHRFKTLGRQHGLPTDIVNSITGHHKKDVADHYGEFPMEAVYRELVKIPAISI